MQTQINNAFAALNARLHADDQAWAIAKLDGLDAGIAKYKAAFDEGSNTCAIVYRHGRVFSRDLAKIEHYGSKGMYNLLDGRGRVAALEMMAKNTAALIAKRDAQIIKALTKAGTTDLPEFELAERSDGYEGLFRVANRTVTIRTILAGGYNIQRLHQRTLVKVQ